jgi:hypothetical protein
VAERVDLPGDARLNPKILQQIVMTLAHLLTKQKKENGQKQSQGSQTARTEEEAKRT